MNRYDVASVAKFSPLSFNELAAAPTMMRQKHDASIAQAEALRIKANPLDKHLNRSKCDLSELTSLGYKIGWSNK